MNKNKNRRIVPAFATEAEEADWWYQNREAHGKDLLAAVKSGEAQILTREKLLARIEASKKKPAPVVSLRIPQDDLLLARKQAERKGLPYQTYIKSLLHETLVKREKKAGYPSPSPCFLRALRASVVNTDPPHPSRRQRQFQIPHPQPRSRILRPHISMMQAHRPLRNRQP